MCPRLPLVDAPQNLAVGHFIRSGKYHQNGHVLGPRPTTRLNPSNSCLVTFVDCARSTCSHRWRSSSPSTAHKVLNPDIADRVSGCRPHAAQEQLKSLRSDEQRGRVVPDADLQPQELLVEAHGTVEFAHEHDCRGRPHRRPLPVASSAVTTGPTKHR